MRATEVAALLGTTNAAVDSALQRARARLQKVAPDMDDVAEPADPEQRALLDRYAAALENADITALKRLLTEDAVWEMPPFPTWFTGREAIGHLLAYRSLAGCSGSRIVVPTRASGQPAFAQYVRRGGGVHRAHAVQVLTVTGSGVARVVSSHEPGLFATFGPPAALPAAADAARAV